MWLSAQEAKTYDVEVGYPPTVCPGVRPTIGSSCMYETVSRPTINDFQFESSLTWLVYRDTTL